MFFVWDCEHQIHQKALFQAIGISWRSADTKIFVRLALQEYKNSSVCYLPATSLPSQAALKLHTPPCYKQ